MHPAGEVGWVQESFVHEFSAEVSAGVGGDLIVKREISCFGTDDDLIALEFSCRNHFPEGGADVTLRPLVAVVDRRVQKVDAGSKRQAHGLRVSQIGFGSGFAQIGAEAEGRNPEVTCFVHVYLAAEVSGLAQAGKAAAIARAAFRRGKPL